MDNSQLFTQALGLESPWYVKGLQFKESDRTGKKELHIEVDFHRGSKFSCSVDGCSYTGLSVHDTREKVWRLCLVNTEPKKKSRKIQFAIIGNTIINQG